jgi:hypothetical protein
MIIQVANIKQIAEIDSALRKLPLHLYSSGKVKE